MARFLSARAWMRPVILGLGLLSLGACSTVSDLFDSSDRGTPRTLGSPAQPQRAQGQADGFPNLASVPERPQPQNSAEDRRQITGALASDRQNARYTDEQLRGRPPESRPPAPPTPSQLPPADLTARPPAPQVQASPSPRPQPPISPQAQAGVAAQPQPQLQPQAQPQPRPQAPAATTAVPAPAPAPVLIPPSAGPVSVEQVFAQQMQASGARTLGGAQAISPPLRPSAPPVTAAVPPPATQGNQRFALAGGGPLTEPTLVPVEGNSPLRSVRDRGMRLDVGVIYFDRGAINLTNDDMAVVRGAARLQQEQGGILRIVGHASSRTDNMTAERYSLTNFNVSLRRAQAVASALMRAGVVQEAIMVEARSDRDLVYYEAMPVAEDYNRRVEIFLDN